MTDFGVALSLFFRDPDGPRGKCASTIRRDVDLKPPAPRRPAYDQAR